MSYMDRKNILSEGLIDKIIGILTKKKQIKNLKKAEKKAYDDALKSVRATGKSLDAALRKVGVDPKQFEV